jgi:hypothetical protein
MWIDDFEKYLKNIVKEYKKLKDNEDRLISISITGHYIASKEIYDEFKKLKRKHEKRELIERTLCIHHDFTRNCVHDKRKKKKCKPLNCEFQQEPYYQCS